MSYCYKSPLFQIEEIQKDLEQLKLEAKSLQKQVDKKTALRQVTEDFLQQLKLKIHKISGSIDEADKLDAKIKENTNYLEGLQHEDKTSQLEDLRDK